MIDMLFDSAAAEDAAEALDIDAVKKRIFKSILQAEAPHLTSSGKLLAEIEAEIDAGGGARAC